MAQEKGKNFHDKVCAKTAVWMTPLKGSYANSRSQKDSKKLS
ncbi:MULTISPECIES: hypothetical protein [Fischerella]|nr:MULTISPECIES: hypothetical protein [Fischerella]